MKQQCGETLGDLEPVYHLFTSDSITLSQAVTHVAYTRKSTVKRNEPYKMCKRTKPLITNARYKKVYNKTQKEELAKNEALTTNKGTIL